MIAHFIKSTVFEVFYLLTKDNVVIDKLVAYGNGVDMVQDLSYVFYKTVPWQNYKFQLICSLLTLNVKNIYLSALALVFVLSFVMSFGFLCYQVQTSGTIYTSTLLKATRYQYGLLSTFLFFPTIEQLINTVSIESTTWLLISLICIVIFLLYASIVCLGSFLLFSPNPDPRIHSSRNSQLVDAFEIISKIFVAVGFGFLDPKTACFIQFIVRLSLYTASVITPSFYNHKSNVIRSGVFLGLLVGSIASIIVCYVQVSFYVCYILLGVVLLLSAIGMAFFHFYQNLKTLPSPLFYFALNCSPKFKFSKKSRSNLSNAVDEILCKVLFPFEIINLVRNLSNCYTDKDKRRFVNTISRKNTIMNDDEEVQDSDLNNEDLIKKKKKIQAIMDQFEHDFYHNFEDVIRIVIIQLFESGMKRFPDSAWLQSQYLIVLQCSCNLFPKASKFPQLLDYSYGILNDAFVKEKSINVEYVLFSFYKKRLFELAANSKSELKNVIDVVAYSYDKEKYLNSIYELANSGLQFVSILERESVDYPLMISFASDMQLKWDNSRYYLRKCLSRVPNSSDLLLLYKDACTILDNNTSLRDYLNNIISMTSSLPSSKESGYMALSDELIEIQKKELFLTPNKLKLSISRLYDFLKQFLKGIYMLLMALCSVYLYFILFDIKKVDLYLEQGNINALTFGIATESFYNHKYSYEHLNNIEALDLTKMDAIDVYNAWLAIIDSNQIKSQQPSPFDIPISIEQSGVQSEMLFEDSVYNLRLDMNFFNLNPNLIANLDANMINFQKGFLSFFIAIHEYSDEYTDHFISNILYSIAPLYSLLLIATSIVVFYSYKAINTNLYFIFI